MERLRLATIALIGACGGDSGAGSPPIVATGWISVIGYPEAPMPGGGIVVSFMVGDQTYGSDLGGCTFYPSNPTQFVSLDGGEVMVSVGEAPPRSVLPDDSNTYPTIDLPGTILTEGVLISAHIAGGTEFPAGDVAINYPPLPGGIDLPPQNAVLSRASGLTLSWDSTVAADLIVVQLYNNLGTLGCFIEPSAGMLQLDETKLTPLGDGPTSLAVGGSNLNVTVDENGYARAIAAQCVTGTVVNLQP